MQPAGYGAPGIHYQRQHHHPQQQQFMEDDCCSSVFPISSAQNQTQYLYPQNSQHSQEQVQVQRIFQQQHPVAITHQLFQHQFHSFQQQERLNQPQLVQQLGTGQPPHPLLRVNFRLGLNESRDNREAGFNQEQIAFLHRNEDRVSDDRSHSLPMPHSWLPQEDLAIKKSIWKPRNISNTKQYCNQNENEEQHIGKSNNTEGNNKRPFGELEAIYGLVKTGETNQTGSGSALTGENSPSNAGLSIPFSVNPPNVGATGCAVTGIGVDHGSETSIGEEASLKKCQKRKRKRKTKEKMSSMAVFFENLVKQVMDHQEVLHRKFLEVVGRMDMERKEREEAWRREDAAKYNREDIARAHQQALASSREALIVSHIEKITGQSINFPTRNTPVLSQQEISTEPINNNELKNTKVDTNTRWPKDEVEALIQVRSGIELKFQEPGLKGPLWEEVSCMMASMGYQRSAKRCKEKWENINKYFRKSKDTAKKRSQQSKTCSYFDQLDKLYSKAPINLPSSPSCDVGIQRHGYSELLLDAFTAGKEHCSAVNLTTENFNAGEMGFTRLIFDGIVNEKAELEQENHGKEKASNGYARDKDSDQEQEHEDEHHKGDSQLRDY